eukprot:ANDGO_07577.mRNA.1 hypothetical protein
MSRCALRCLWTFLLVCLLWLSGPLHAETVIPLANTTGLTTIRTESLLFRSGTHVAEITVFEKMFLLYAANGSNLQLAQTLDVSSKFTGSRAASTNWVLLPIFAADTRLFYLSRDVSTLRFSIHSLHLNTTTSAFADEPLLDVYTGSSILSASASSDDRFLYSSFQTPNTSIIVSTYDSVSSTWSATTLFTARNIWLVEASARFAVVYKLRAKELQIHDLDASPQSNIIQTLSFSDIVEDVKLSGSTLLGHHMIVKLLTATTSLRYYQWDAVQSQFALRNSSFTLSSTFGRKYSIAPQWIGVALDTGVCQLWFADPLTAQYQNLTLTHSFSAQRCKSIDVASTATHAARVRIQSESILDGSFVRVFDVSYS